ncbi:MAG: type III secretion inner membrane ring lipoprotein SctJ [Chlamydiae bacterium]|nr:type III secretion inner membrane ring lipoprotein SctJ [Chlamydiota bacterium]
MMNQASFRFFSINYNLIRRSRRALSHFLLLALSLIFLSACQTDMIIVTDLEEREANEIIVFLASKGIPAHKTAIVSSNPAGGGGAAKYSIGVESGQSTEAMAILNQNGLPRIKGTNLLDLFAKQGLMTSDKEETIRYQAGLAEQIANTIRKIDGVIDADVQLSFPPESTGIVGPQQQAPQKITAAIYVKHQGILDDPNSHLIIKIKRLVAGSVNGLDVNDVTVISDRSRFTDITLNAVPEESSPSAKEYVSIWSIVMSKSSASRFRFIFFFLSFFVILLAVVSGWIIWKFYPMLKRKGGLRQLLNPLPMEHEVTTSEETPGKPLDKL